MNDRYLLQQMLQRVKAINPDYPADMQIDGRHLLKAAEFVYKQMSLDRGVENNAYEIIPVWDQLYTAAYNDPFYKDKSLATICNHIQEFYQKVKNGNGKQISGTKLKQKLAARLKNRK